MDIRETSTDDLAILQCIHRQAFGQEEEANLVRDLLADPSAKPTVSLLAVEDGRPLGHVLFSAARLAQAENPHAATILAPLAVIPEAQGRGVGSLLVEAGLKRLQQAGIGLVFVLGDPRYYGRFGFEPAAPRGLAAPYPLPEAYAEAWMVKALGGDPDSVMPGRVTCCDALSDPALWRE